MDLDPAVAQLLSENDMSAAPDPAQPNLIFVSHVPSGLSLARSVWPDLFNTGNAVDALLIVVGRQGLEP